MAEQNTGETPSHHKSWQEKWKYFSKISNVFLTVFVEFGAAAIVLEKNILLKGLVMSQKCKNMLKTNVEKKI